MQLWGHILEQVYNIISQHLLILPRRVLFIFISQFIEEVLGWKLNSRKFYYNLY